MNSSYYTAIEFHSLNKFFDSIHVLAVLHLTISVSNTNYLVRLIFFLFNIKGRILHEGQRDVEPSLSSINTLIYILPKKYLDLYRI